MATFEVRVTTDLLNKQLNPVGDHLLEGTYLDEEREVDWAQLQLPAMRGTPAHMAETGCHHMVHTSAGDMVYYVQKRWHWPHICGKSAIPFEIAGQSAYSCRSLQAQAWQG